MGDDSSRLRSTEGDLASLELLWGKSRDRLRWGPLFVLPPWLKSWWEAFDGEGFPFLYTVNDEAGELVGFAPLLIRDAEARFQGSEEVCDYMDFVAVPGREREFLEIFWEDLNRRGLRCLCLGAVRHDSRVARYLAAFAEGRKCQVAWEDAGVSVEMGLPESWENYLKGLPGKQRHELRRKLRRLNEAGSVNYRVIRDIEGRQGVLELFFELFRNSRKDKEEFMEPRMEIFFRAVAMNMSRAGLLRMGVLELDGEPVAQVMGFDHEGVRYLYNSGFDPRFASLSVGLLSKALFIKDAMEAGMRTFDFLKGPEVYKYRLGGKEVPLKRLTLVLR